MPETCSFCKNTVSKCMIVCDNDCGVKYCSDSCADADNGHHHKNNQAVVSYHPSHRFHLSRLFGQFISRFFSK